MVKFYKQFEGQLVPEWKEAFVDYWQLKKDLKKIQLLNNNTPPSNDQECSIFSSLRRFSLYTHQHRDHGIIKVHAKPACSRSMEDLYKTELLEQFTDNRSANEFFGHLDLQLNKVNQFYRTKEREFIERGESLNKQLEILIKLIAALRQQQGREASSLDSMGDASISCHISYAAEEDSVKSNTEWEQEQNNATDELGTLRSDELDRSRRINKEDDDKMRAASNNAYDCQSRNLKISIPLTTPSRTLMAISYLVWDDLMNQSSKKFSSEGNKIHINRTKLHHAEKMIKRAFIELYKGLDYLKTYRNLNMLAFVKILKKFDKVTNKQILPTYLKVVESSYFNSSGKVMKLADEVEELFVKHFADDDRRKAMKYLKPRHHKESHVVTFFVGLFSGCAIALFSGYVILAHIAGMYRQQADDTVYMETAYPVLSVFFLLFLHLLLYGCNIFMWKKARINYSFIFELAPTKELKCQDVILICTTSMTAVVGVMLLHLSLVAKGYTSTQVQALPGFVMLLLLLLLICPFNIIYQSSRYRLLRVIRNIIFSPLYKVVMLDFFIADQLCSQVPMLRNLEYITCYYVTGSYSTQDYGYCTRTKHYKDLAYAVSFLPYYWRAMQCARRWFDEGQSSHLVNLGKYVSAMLAAGAKVAYEKERSAGWLCLLIVVSSAATVYQLYWDYVKDWGLLQPHSKNPWLRDELMLHRKIFYFFSMALNLILRLAWLQSVFHSSFGGVDYRVTGLFLGALEVIRRGQWNFYRLENEHLNNAGKFRAVKTVPLPFHEVDEKV